MENESRPFWNIAVGSQTSRWLLYNIAICFATYWTGNIILWYPWKVNANLGITMMLTIMPLFWGCGIYLCLIRYNGKNILAGTALTSLSMLISAVVMDYIFFGLIRRALSDLYKPTTFYGYGFLALFPFVELLLFRKIILRKKRNVLVKDFFPIGIIGLASLVIQIIMVINL